jgi:hypothetical protein
MSGPRGLNRSPKPFERPADAKEIIGKKSYFSVQAWGNGWAINIHRRGQFVETVMCASPGEVNRIRAKLSDEGLIGINEVGR